MPPAAKQRKTAVAAPLVRQHGPEQTVSLGNEAGHADDVTALHLEAAAGELRDLFSQIDHNLEVAGQHLARA